MECGVIWIGNMDQEEGRHQRNDGVWEVDMTNNGESQLEGTQDKWRDTKTVEEIWCLIGIIPSQQWKWLDHKMKGDSPLRNITMEEWKEKDKRKTKNDVNGLDDEERLQQVVEEERWTMWWTTKPDVWTYLGRQRTKEEDNNLQSISVLETEVKCDVRAQNPLLVAS